MLVDIEKISFKIKNKSLIVENGNKDNKIQFVLVEYIICCFILIS